MSFCGSFCLWPSLCATLCLPVKSVNCVYLCQSLLVYLYGRLPLLRNLIVTRYMVTRYMVTSYMATRYMVTRYMVTRYMATRYMVTRYMVTKYMVFMTCVTGILVKLYHMICWLLGTCFAMCQSDFFSASYKRHAIHILMVLCHICFVLEEGPGVPVITRNKKKIKVKGISKSKGKPKDIVLKGDLTLEGWNLRGELRTSWLGTTQPVFNYSNWMMGTLKH